MTESLVDVQFTPELTEPVLVVAMDGWIDAGGAAATAMTTLMSATNAETIAEFDADRLLDHRARRPIMHLVNGLITDLTWPAIELRAGTDADGSDVLLLVGAEPDFEWQAFADAVVDLAHDHDCRMVVTMGAYPAPVAHTRPTALSVTTSSTELSDSLHGYVRGTLEVPGGIHAVLDVAANNSGIPAMGIWAQVPHYISAMPYPAASVALLEGLEEVAGVRIEPGQLPSDAKATRIRLDELVAENTQHQTMVAQLEELMDQGLGGPDDAPTFGFDHLPSGDELAEELQEFLREHPEED
ncbi:MAG: proteasome assembly chaperone family protein [Microthrixaceae bacterium]